MVRKILYIAVVLSVLTIGGTAYSASDKSDGGECTGHETVGRCADKCANQGEFVRGFDKETGAIVCGRVTGCPYGDSIPLGPECDRFAPKPDPQPIETAPESDFTGK